MGEGERESGMENIIKEREAGKGGRGGGITKKIIIKKPPSVSFPISQDQGPCKILPDWAVPALSRLAPNPPRGPQPSPLQDPAAGSNQACFRLQAPEMEEQRPVWFSC